MYQLPNRTSTASAGLAGNAALVGEIWQSLPDWTTAR
jgi:hypothetical protein